jgi:outer membrane biosynthesis protein TonB
MPYAPLKAEGNLTIAERRFRRRLRPSSLIFINLDDLNGGMVFNISESGLALSAAMALPNGYLSNMRIQFPGSTDWIVVSGRIVWKSKSNKEAGLQFVGLKEGARQEIIKWISSEASPGEVPLESKASIGYPKEASCQLRKDSIFSVASRDESLPDPCAPSIGPTKDANYRVGSRISQEPSLGELPLESKTPLEAWRALSAGANDAEKSLATERPNPGKAVEVKVRNTSVTIQPNVSRGVLENLAAKRARQTQGTSGNLHHPERSSSATDRRVHRRTRIVPLGYLQLGESNGGIALNVSEGGLAITAAMPLAHDSLPKLKFQFPDSHDSIETSGQIAWKSKSKREAGVRFVGLTEQARQQIRDWLSSQLHGDESHRESITPPVPIDSQQVLGEPGFRSPGILLPEIPNPDAAEEPLAWSGDKSAESQSPLNLAPNSMNELTVDQRRNGSVERNPGGNVSPISNRRVRSRKCLVPPMYIDLGSTNGGIVLNAGEGGLSLTSAIPLIEDQLPCMRFQLPYSHDWIEVKGQIAWKSASGKQAGIKFVEVGDAAQRQIREWISSEELPGGVQEQIEKIRHAENSRLESLILDLPVPVELVQENSGFLHASPGETASSLDLEVALRGPKVGPSSRIPSGVRFLKAIRRAKERGRNLGIQSRNWRRIAAAAGVIGLVTFTVQRIAPKTDVGNKVIATVARKIEGTSGAVKAEPLPNETRIIGAPISGAEKVGLQARRAESLPAKKHQSIPGVSTRNSPKQVGIAERLSASSVLNRPNSLPENAPTLGQRTKEFPLSPARVLGRPVHPTLPQGVGDVAATPPQLEANIASPVNSDSGLSRNAFPVDSRKKETSPPPPKPPESPVSITGVVAVRTDPYPSLRMPAEHASKKAKQGSSLQLGHLISRVEPVYPDEAKHKGIEGTVKLHAIIGRNGAVESLMSVDGPPSLVPVAMSAVRQWRFTETLLGGQSVETEEDVAVTFRLSKSGTSK